MNTNTTSVGTGLICPYLSTIAEDQHLSDVSNLRRPIHWDGRSLAVKIYRSWNELEEVLWEWEDILGVNPALSIFCTPEWMGSWWKTFGADRRMMTVAFRNSNNVPIGLAPLYLADFGWSPLRKLGCLKIIGDGSGDSDNIDIIVRPGFEDPCAEALLQWLSNQSDWDICCLSMLPDNSKIARALANQLNVAKWSLTVERTPNSAIDLPSSWEGFVERLAGDFRPLVTRYPKRLSNRYRVRIHRCDSVEELDRALEVLFSLHQKRWNQVNESGSFGCEQRRQFYRLMSESFLQMGWLELWLLELDGVDVAAQFCFRYRKTAYILQEGFDPTFSGDKVGYVLRSAVLRHLIDSGIQKYDFLGGFNNHKQNWGAQLGSYLTLNFAAPHTIGSYCLHSAKFAREKKEWFRQHLPGSAWSMLRWAKSKIAPQSSALRAA